MINPGLVSDIEHFPSPQYYNLVNNIAILSFVFSYNSSDVSPMEKPVKIGSNFSSDFSISCNTDGI